MLLAALLPLIAALSVLYASQPAKAKAQPASATSRKSRRRLVAPGEDSPTAAAVHAVTDELVKAAKHDVAKARRDKTRASRLAASAKRANATKADHEAALAAAAVAKESQQDAVAAAKRANEAKSKAAQHARPQKMNAQASRAAQLAAEKAKRQRAKHLAKRAQRDQSRAEKLANVSPAASSEVAKSGHENTVAARRASRAADATAVNNAATIPPPVGQKHLTKKEAALRMREYLATVNTVDAFGTRRKPNARIKVWQRYLGVVDDGIVGSKTAAAASAVGVTLPPRPRSSGAPSASIGPARIVPNNSPASIAADLRDFLTLNRTSEAYGYRGHPSGPVQEFQAAAGITADGIYGANTHAAALRYGVTLPPRP